MVRNTLAGLTLIEIDTKLRQIPRNLRIVRGSFSADANVAPIALGAHHSLSEHLPAFPGSRSSKSKATISESRSTPSVSCVRSFEPIENPSNNSRKRVDLDDVVRNLAHHVDLKSVLTAASARWSRHASLITCRASVDAPAEGHHDAQDW